MAHLRILVPVLLLATVMTGDADRTSEQRLAQAPGFRCQTSFGVCPIAPAPIGAPCFCGNVPGTVVP